MPYSLLHGNPLFVISYDVGCLTQYALIVGVHTVFIHVPEAQSAVNEHVFPGATPLHLLVSVLQSSEAQSLSAVQSSLNAPRGAVHTKFVHVPEAQSVPFVHVAPETPRTAVHFDDVHVPEAHSLPFAHATPAALRGVVHWPAALHTPDTHPLSATQAAPAAPGVLHILFEQKLGEMQLAGPQHCWAGSLETIGLSVSHAAAGIPEQQSLNTNP